MAGGEFRSDVTAGLLALAVAGLTGRALAQYWVSDGARPSLADIPDLVLTCSLAPAQRERRVTCQGQLPVVVVVLPCLLAAQLVLGMTTSFSAPSGRTRRFCPGRIGVLPSWSAGAGSGQSRLWARPAGHGVVSASVGGMRAARQAG
jgi:hypothetical protein